MHSLEAICNALTAMAPLRLAEEWDNVGLLVGDRKQSVQRVMTCLTITPNVVEEAIEDRVELIVAHHPLPFQPLKRLTSDTIPGGMLLRLIRGGVAVYSAHTAFDSAADGINQRWATMLGLNSIETLVKVETGAEKLNSDGLIEGTGRLGLLSKPESLRALIGRAASAVGAGSPRCVGDLDQKVSKIALACGSGGSFLNAAKRRGCDAIVTGEATFHTCLEAESLGIGMGLLGHYWSERFAME
ncbi:MAG: Nif3-like dinuclear metal center hexameric protein, partial [Rubripirellula sp.]